MTQRFYLEPTANAESLAAGITARLTDAEAHHFLHVMRGKVGEEIVVFDGLGHECSAIVTALTRREVEVRIDTVVELPKQWSYPFHLGVSLPKGDRARWLVEKLTELGVPSLTPLITERANARPDAKSLEKLGRYSIEACKQCGRNQLLTIEEPCTLEEIDQRVSSVDSVQETMKVVCHPYGREALPFSSLAMLGREWHALSDSEGRAAPLVSVQDAWQSSTPFVPQDVRPLSSRVPLAVVIGPEGGLSESEIDVLVSLKWHLMELGPRILRIETAAIAVASYLAPMMED